jgi:hypothetical protein
MHAASFVCAAVLSTLSLPVIADEVIYATPGPYGGPMGVTGFDVYDGQSVAIRFSPARNCTLTEVSLWLMCNTSPGQEISPTLAVSIREDAVTGPAAEPLMTWTCQVAPVPFQPSLRVLEVEDQGVLLAGQSYWVVAESGCNLQRNPVWNWSGTGSGFVALRAEGGAWSAMEGVAVSVEVRGETCGTADFNRDSDFGTDQDIEAFFACLAGRCCSGCGTSDFNLDGDFGTDQDIEAFFRVLAGGVC